MMLLLWCCYDVGWVHKALWCCCGFGRIGRSKKWWRKKTKVVGKVVAIDPLGSQSLYWWDETLAVGPILLDKLQNCHWWLIIRNFKNVHRVSELAHPYLKILRYVNWVKCLNNHPNKPTTRDPHRYWVMS